jgi:hypothetical protein
LQRNKVATERAYDDSQLLLYAKLLPSSFWSRPSQRPKPWILKSSASAARHRALEGAAGLPRGWNVDAVQAVRAPLDPKRPIVVHECVARHLRERWAGQ